MNLNATHTMTLDEMNRLSKGTLVENLGIKYTEQGEDYLMGTMPVDERTRQPLGLLHGGASAAFAETLGSMASLTLVNPETHSIVGIEINATHVRKATSGIVTGKATLVSRSRKLHVWDIRISNEEGQTTCISRLTVMVITKK
jgi:1,4-dihydroxy-2-naphthoyl-CoA hydrolase